MQLSKEEFSEIMKKDGWRPLGEYDTLYEKMCTADAKKRGEDLAKEIVVKPKFDQRHLDHLADVAWFIKGMIQAGDTTFDQGHSRAFSESMTTIKRDYDTKEV